MGKKKIKIETVRIEKLITTTDDWYPNFEEDKVRLSLSNIRGSNNRQWDIVRICVWGNDDFGLEMDFEGGTEIENEAKFNFWKEKIYDKVPEPCTQDYFYNLGFVRA